MHSNDQVTNEMSVVSDHGVYWQNDEQVVVRLIAEIDMADANDLDHTESPFWRGAFADDWPALSEEKRTEGMRVAVQRRRKRVMVLAVARAFLFVAWLGACGAWWAGYRPLGGVISRVMPWIYDGPLPDWLTAFLVYGLVAFAFYAIVMRFLLWDPYDRWARGRAIAMMATSESVGGIPEQGKQSIAGGDASQRGVLPTVDGLLSHETGTSPEATRRRAAADESVQPRSISSSEE